MAAGEFTANGATVLGGTITMPRTGPWRADVDVALADPSSVTGAVAITSGDLGWKGTSLEVGAFVGRAKVRIVGGAGGLRKPTSPKYYHAIPARVVIEDVLGEGGEKLSDTSDRELLGTIFSLWTRPAGIVKEGLEMVVDELGATWRVLPDGTVWVGKEKWPTTTAPQNVRVLDSAPHDGRIEFASDAPNLIPGVVFQDRKVREVEIKIDASEVRTDAWFMGDDEEGGDVVVNAIERVIDQRMKHVDFYAIRGGKVVSQNADGTLEIRMDDPSMPGLSKVPIAYGIPGVTVTVAGGGRVHVEWEGGSPAKPRAVVVDPTCLKTITIKASSMITVDAPEIVAQNGRPLARVGDMVQVLTSVPGSPSVGQIMTGNNQHRG